MVDDAQRSHGQPGDPHRNRRVEADVWISGYQGIGFESLVRAGVRNFEQIVLKNRMSTECMFPRRARPLFEADSGFEPLAI